MTREFDRAYTKTGRLSIAPERLLRALLLQVFYSVRSERLLMEQLDAQGQATRTTQHRLVVSDDRGGFQSLPHPETGTSLTFGPVAASPPPSGEPAIPP